MGKCCYNFALNPVYKLVGAHLEVLGSFRQEFVLDKEYWLAGALLWLHIGIPNGWLQYI